ncbi:MAG: hypothetical protein J6C23_03325 [Clostridia bacterium]|nr:hypothetical protein [Clostridia bacterium]
MSAKTETCTKCGRTLEYQGKGYKLCKYCYFEDKAIPCRACGKLFIPTEKHHWYCNKCYFKK